MKKKIIKPSILSDEKGGTIPSLGLTAYLFGDVVFILNAAYLSVLLINLIILLIFLFKGAKYYLVTSSISERTWEV